MNKRYMFLMVTIGLAMLPFAHGGSAGDRPPGVDVHSWVALSETAGLVIRHPRSVMDTWRSERGAIAGTLMVRYQGVWRKLDLELGSAEEP